MLARLVEVASRPRVKLLLFISAIILCAILGFAIRTLPLHRWEKYGVFIDAFDPWIEYWSAKYLHEHGLSSWFELRPPNEAVMKFWYPWGRDFTRTSYPLVPMLIAATYPLVAGLVSFQLWAALIPPIAGATLSIVLGYLIYRRFGLLPGIVAAFLAALLPAASDRTTLGFIEKEGVVLPFVILSLYFYSRAFEHHESTKRMMLYSVLAGLAASLVGLGWGGYLLIVAVAAVAPLLLPAAGVRVERRHVILPLGFYAGFIPAMLLSRFRGITAFYKMPGGLLLASAILVFVLALGYEKLQRPRSNVARLAARILTSRLLYLAIAVITVIVGLPIAYLLGLVNVRAFFLLMPPGIRQEIAAHRGPLVQSIAEHSPPSPAMLSLEVGVVTILLAFTGIIYMLYRVVSRGDAGLIPVLIATAVGYYAMLNAAYFIQTGGVFTALAASASVAIPLEFMTRRVGRRVEFRSEALLASVMLVALLALNLAYIWLAPHGGSSLLERYERKLPMILTSAVTETVYAPAWLDMLEYIKNVTSKETVVVSWWDYGYWISVVGDRPSLADGATYNATQISILARILVGDYHKAPELLRKLHCRPNETLVIAYEVYILRFRGASVVAALWPSADYPKSYWMIRIGGLDVDNYLTRGIPDPAKPGVRNGLLYRMLFQAPLLLTDEEVVKLGDRRVYDLVKGKHVVVAYLDPNRPLRGPELELLEPMEYFKPFAVSAYILGRTRAGDLVVVIVAAYKWTG